jgi:hypothetical protein
LRVTVRHYYDFGADRAIVGTDLASPESWDRLRAHSSGAFAIPATREAFIQLAEKNTDLASRGHAIDAWLTDRGSSSVASYGVGGAMLEWWLKEIRPDRPVICADYAAATVERLNDLVPELDVRQHDLRHDGPIGADVHLFHRIDTELSNSEWREVFGRFKAVPILVVATRVLDDKAVLLEILDRPRKWLRRASRAGFLRTRDAFGSLWLPTHHAVPLRVHDLEAWCLTPRIDSSARRGVVG